MRQTVLGKKARQTFTIAHVPREPREIWYVLSFRKILHTNDRQPAWQPNKLGDMAYRSALQQLLANAVSSWDSIRLEKEVCLQVLLYKERMNSNRFLNMLE